MVIFHSYVSLPEAIHIIYILYIYIICIIIYHLQNLYPIYSSVKNFYTSLYFRFSSIVCYKKGYRITFCNLIHIYIYNYIHTHTYTRCKSNCQPSYEPTLPMVWGPLLTSSTNTCELKPIASQFINGSLPILSNISLGWNMIIYECHKSIAVSQHESAGYI